MREVATMRCSTGSILALAAMVTITSAGWDKNTFLNLSATMATEFNVTKCWICTEMTSHANQKHYPVVGAPASLTNWSLALSFRPGSPGENDSQPHRPIPCVTRVKAPLCIESGGLTNGTVLDVGRYSSCNHTMIFAENNLYGTMKNTITATNCTADGQVGYRKGANFTTYSWEDKEGPWVMWSSGLLLNSTGCTTPDSTRSPSVVTSNLQRVRFCALAANYSLNHYSECMGEQANEAGVRLWAQGLFFLCGGAAYKELPTNWKGVCTIGYILPKARILQNVTSHHINKGNRNMNKRRVKISVGHDPTEEEGGYIANILVEQPEWYHRMGRALHPMGTVVSLEYAIKNISRVVEGAFNATYDALEEIQEEVSSLKGIVLQNRMVLDQLLASQGGSVWF